MNGQARKTIRPDVTELFPEARIYTDKEVAAVIYRGAHRSFQTWLDRQPVTLCYRGPRAQRLMTRVHISRALERMEAEAPKLAHLKSAKKPPRRKPLTRSTNDAITRAKNALNDGKQKKRNDKWMKLGSKLSINMWHASQICSWIFCALGGF